MALYGYWLKTHHAVTNMYVCDLDTAFKRILFIYIKIWCNHSFFDWFCMTFGMTTRSDFFSGLIWRLLLFSISTSWLSYIYMYVYRKAIIYFRRCIIQGFSLRTWVVSLGFYLPPPHPPSLSENSYKIRVSEGKRTNLYFTRNSLCKTI